MSHDDKPAARIGVLTISDRASRGEYPDRSGPAISYYLEDVVKTPFETDYRVIPDEQIGIEEAMIDMADNSACSLVLCTGGTGPALRDVTPEALEAVCAKMMPGFGELMRTVSLDQVPTAILSRQTAGIRGHTLFILLPGKPSAIQVCLDAVFAAVPYCLDLIGGAYLETFPKRLEAFRPKKK